MNIPCVECGRVFGGHETYKRHLLKREDRCRTEGEMKAIGLFSDIAGVWRRTGSRTATGQASLIDRRTVGRVAKASRRQRRSVTVLGVPHKGGAHHAGNGLEAQGATGGRG